MQKFVAVGRLTQDAELRYSINGTPITRGRIAIHDGVDAQGRELSTFVDIVVFGQSAEPFGAYARKGRMVGITGRLRIRSWTGVDGAKHITPEIVVDNWRLLDSRPKEAEGELAEEVTTNGTNGVAHGASREEYIDNLGEAAAADDEVEDDITAPF